MKSKYRLMVLSTVVVLAILIPFKNVAADKISPGTNNGKKWRIGYDLSDKFKVFPDILLVGDRFQGRVKLIDCPR